MNDKKKTKGDLDIFVLNIEDEVEEKLLRYNEVLIHGDPEGLRSFGELLISLSDLDQGTINDNSLPKGAREHYHLRPNIELSKSSVEVIVGRLDAKGSGDFYSRYISKENSQSV